MLELLNKYHEFFSMYLQRGPLTDSEIRDLKHKLNVFINSILDRPCAVNEQDQNGNTLLHFILNAGNGRTNYSSEHIEELIICILKNGGNLAIKNNAHLTPITPCHD